MKFLLNPAKMRLEAFLATVMVCLVHTSFADQNEHSRSRRSILEFGTLIECATGGSWADYSAYGCYCGFGGSGRPVDATDRCCQQHDACYSRSKRGGGCPQNDKLFSMLGLEVPAIYTQTYEFTVKNCAQPSRVQLSCKKPNQYSFWRRMALGDTLKCAHSLCQCDRIAAECFAKNRVTYNKKFLDLSNVINKQRCGPANFQRRPHN